MYRKPFVSFVAVDTALLVIIVNVVSSSLSVFSSCFVFVAVVVIVFDVDIFLPLILPIVAWLHYTVPHNA
jgi:hypothetical protein